MFTLQQQKLFKINTSKHLFSTNTSKHLFSTSAVEKKIMVVFFYYILLALSALTTYTVTERNSERLKVQFTNYFICEQDGHDQANPCDRNSFSDNRYPEMFILSVILIALWPFVNIVYVLDLKEVVKKLEMLFSRSCVCVRVKSSQQET